MASWFQTPLGPNHIPNFVSAPSAQALRVQMRSVTKKHKAFIVWNDIQWNSTDKRWYAWYYVTDSIEQQMQELKGGN